LAISAIDPTGCPSKSFGPTGTRVQTRERIPWCRPAMVRDSLSMVKNK
jgi:hypothetical protein